MYPNFASLSGLSLKVYHVVPHNPMGMLAGINFVSRVYNQ